MDHKILILGITIFIVILFLSFRKEKYENEEDIGEVEVPPSFNISEFLKKLELAKEEKRKNDETLDALYDTTRDENQDSQEEAAAAIEEEDRAQYTFLKDLVNSIQQDEDQIREKARNQVKSELEKTVTDQARDYFENKSTGYENLPTPKKKGIVKVNNVKFDSFSAALGAAVDISTYGGTNVYGKDDTYYSARVPYCHLRRKLQNGESVSGDGCGPLSPPNCQRQFKLAESNYSCLNRAGVPDNVGENGFTVDSFEECATLCLNSDLCSGFSIVPDGTFPKEGFGMTCKMTHHEFEDTIIQGAWKNEQVFAVHEDDKLKNPLYFEIMNSNYKQSLGEKGSDYHKRGDWACMWRTACDYYPYCYGTHDIKRNQQSTCENGVVIENNGIRRDCEGKMVYVDYAGTEHNTNDERFLNHVCETGQEYSIKFKRTPGGKDAINGGACPEGYEENNLKCDRNLTIVEAPDRYVPGLCPSGYEKTSEGDCKKPGPCDTSGRGGTCPASLGHGDMCFAACPPGKEIAHNPNDALYCKYGELSGSGNSCRDSLPDCSWRWTNCRNSASLGPICEWSCPQECWDTGTGCT